MPPSAFAVRAPGGAGALPDGVRAVVAARGVRRLVFFLDYDGTLSPIVSDPDRAFLPADTGAALASLARVHTTAIVSGRALEKVSRLVGEPGLIYAGSHGFDIAGPPGFAAPRTVGGEWRPVLLRAQARLLSDVVPKYPGCTVEDNKLSVSLHYRNAHLGDSLPALDAAVRSVASALGLRVTLGKCVLELRPDVDWHKGRAVDYLLDALGLRSPDVLPVYVGDDRTDEDAFVALRACGGVGVLVAPHDDPRDTAASARLDDPAAVCRFLVRMAQEPAVGQPRA